jgi:HAD superfamily hydrolase (TIGR01509 family)
LYTYSIVSKLAMSLNDKLPLSLHIRQVCYLLQAGGRKNAQDASKLNVTDLPITFISHHASCKLLHGRLIAGLEAAHGFTIPEGDIQSWVDRELVDTLALIKEGAIPCKGIVEALEALQKEGKYDMTVVSSSALPRVIDSLEKTDLIRFFPHHKIFSAASMIPPTSKPDPAVYLHACQSLGVVPRECIAFEDREEEVERMRGVMREVGAKGIMGPWKVFREVRRIYMGSEEYAESLHTNHDEV